MKTPRLRGAALASLAFLASGTVHAQSVFPASAPRYAAPAPPAYAAPQPYTPVYQPAPLPPAFQPMEQAAGYGWSARPISYGAATMVPEPSVSVLGPGPGTVMPPAAGTPVTPGEVVPTPEGNAAGLQRTPSTATPHGQPYSGHPYSGQPYSGQPYSGGVVGPQGGGSGLWTSPGGGSGYGGTYGQGYGTAPGYGAAPGYGGGGYGLGGGVAPGYGGYGAGVYGGGVYGGAPYGGAVVGGGPVYDGGVVAGYGGGAVGYGGGAVGYGGGAVGYGGAAGGYDACFGAAPGGYGYGGGGAGWYVGAYGLLLSMSGQNRYTFSYDTANEANQFTDAKNTEGEYAGGVAFTIGHMFNCGMNAVEFVYWGWYPDEVSTYTYGTGMAGDLNGIFNWDSLTYNGQPGDFWVDNAQVHALYRDAYAQNFELNFLRLNLGGNGGPCNPWQFSLLCGFRYFRLHDHLTFVSDTANGTINGDVSELAYSIKTVNNLWGLQIGGVGTYSVTPRFAFNAGSKFGFFGNYIEHTSAIGGAAGYAVINNGPNAGRVWYVDNDTNDVAFLGEVFVGASYCLGSHWSFSGGYRALALTGVAQPTNQIYPDLRGINDVETIETSGGYILHGAYLGVNFCF